MNSNHSPFGKRQKTFNAQLYKHKLPFKDCFSPIQSKGNRPKERLSIIMSKDAFGGDQSSFYPKSNYFSQANSPTASIGIEKIPEIKLKNLNKERYSQNVSSFQPQSNIYFNSALPAIQEKYNLDKLGVSPKHMRKNHNIEYLTNKYHKGTEEQFQISLPTKKIINDLNQVKEGAFQKKIESLPSSLRIKENNIYQGQNSRLEKQITQRIFQNKKKTLAISKFHQLHFQNQRKNNIKLNSNNIQIVIKRQQNGDKNTLIKYQYLKKSQNINRINSGSSIKLNKTNISSLQSSIQKNSFKEIFKTQKDIYQTMQTFSKLNNQLILSRQKINIPIIISSNDFNTFTEQNIQRNTTNFQNTEEIYKKQFQKKTNISLIDGQIIDDTVDKFTFNQKKIPEVQQRKYLNSNKKLHKRSTTASFISKPVLKTNFQNKFNLSNFIQIKLLGSGSYGTVHLVKQKKSNFICALKKIKKSFVQSQNIIQQLIRQLKIQLFLQHSQIIRMYGFFEDQKFFYILMEVMCDGPLSNKNYRQILQKQAANYLRQICVAVEELNAKQIIHRDIKPQNLMLIDGIIKLGDFGWSVYDKQGSMRNTFCGTPSYLSPEIVKNNPYDYKIDVWSIGVLAYQMLVGTLPFQLKHKKDINKIANQNIILSQGCNISSDAKNFIFRCLEKNPKDRYSCKQLLKHKFITDNIEK